MSSSQVNLETNNFGDPVALASKSGRTRVTADFDSRGKGVVAIYRDGFLAQRFDLSREDNPDN